MYDVFVLQHIFFQMSKEEKHKLLCEVTKSAKADDIALRSYVQSRRKVDFSEMSPIEREAWVMSFDQKIFEVQQCCKMVSNFYSEYILFSQIVSTLFIRTNELGIHLVLLSFTIIMKV